MGSTFLTNLHKDSVSDEDYYYDEGDLTVKPFPSWLTKPAQETTSSIPLSNINKNSTNKPTYLPYLPQKPLLPILIPISAVSTTKGPNISYNTTSFIATDAPTQASLESSSSNSTTEDLITLVKNMSSVDSQVEIDVKPIAPEKLSARTNHILAQNREIPVLHPKQRHTHLSNFLKKSTSTELNSRRVNKKDDSKIYNFKVNRAQKRIPATLGYPIPFRFNYSQRRCRSGHFLDERGTCRNNRASSILRKLFNMLVSLPLTDLEATDEAT